MNNNCVYKTICFKESEYCYTCSNRGLSYLIDKFFMPKTLIPKNLLDVVYDKSELDPIMSQYIEQVVKLTDKGYGIYCWSKETGTGKTTLCCIAMTKYLYLSVRKEPYDLDNRRVLFINTPEFLNKLRRSFDNPDQELLGLWDELFNIDTAPKLILFDDIGAEKLSEWVVERLYSLINFRISNGLACSFTSNLSIKELEDRLGLRIASRVRGCAKELQMEGIDFRRCPW